MTTAADCATTWDNSIFKKAATVRSTFLGPSDTYGKNTSDVPKHFEKQESPGRADFIAWANMPAITYSAKPETLYDMEKLNSLMRNDACFTQAEIARASAQGVTYPKTFYLGLFAGGLALLYTMLRR